MHEHEQSEREKNLLPPTIENAEQVVVAVFTLEDDGSTLHGEGARLAILQVRKKVDRNRRKKRHATEQHEGGPKRYPVIVERERYENERNKGPTLIDRIHPPENCTASCFGRQAHTEGVLCLKYHVITHTGDDDPGGDRPEAVRCTEENVPHAEQHERACGDALKRHFEKQRGEEDQEKPWHLTNRGDVAKLRGGEAKHALEVVRDDILLGIEGKAERRAHQGKQDETTLRRRTCACRLGACDHHKSSS